MARKKINGKTHVVGHITGRLYPEPSGTWRARIEHNGQRIMRVLPTEQVARMWIEEKATAFINGDTPLPQQSAADARAAMELLRALPRPVSLTDAARLCRQVETNSAAGRFDSTDALRALGILPVGISLTDAAQYYLRHNHGCRSVALKDAVDTFLAGKRAVDRRPATLHQYMSHLTMLVDAFPGVKVADITSDNLLRFLADKEVSGLTARNYRASFHAFFEWACKIRPPYRTDNPALAIEKPQPQETIPGILTVPQVTALLKSTVRLHPDLIGFMALGFFAGIRTEELKRLRWPAVNGEFVHIGPDVAKKRRQRYVEILPALTAWLALCSRDNGPVLRPREKVMQTYLKDIREAAELKEWPHNGMRHSFASYHLAAYGDSAKTSTMLGHAGDPSVLFNHYRSVLVPAAGREYFSLTPQKIAE